MKLQKVFEEGLQGFDAQEFTDLMSSDFSGIYRFSEALSDRKSSIKEMGFELDRQLLFAWKKSGLLPFQGKGGTKKKSWTRFSFIELCWIQVMIALRKQGVGMERLKVIMDHLFPDDFIRIMLQVVPISAIVYGIPELADRLKEEGVESIEDIQWDDAISDALQDKQLSLFFCLILSTILMKSNVVIYIDDEGEPGIIDINKMRKTPITGVVRAYEILDNPSVTTVNLSRIINNLFHFHPEVLKQLPGFELK
jgi:hypothetical protein